MKIRITSFPKDVSLLNRALEQAEQTTNDVARLKQNVFTQVNLPQHEGMGSPEGALVAPIGSIYQRLDGGSGTSLYIKESGDGLNTGWVPVNGGAGSPVTSVFGRTGAVVAVSGDYTVGQVTGAAPLASPTFTGVPAGPTAAPGTNTTQLATTAFVQAAVTGLVKWTTVVKTTTYTAVAGDMVLANTSGGGFTVTLPAAGSNANLSIRIKKTSSDGNSLVIGRTGSDVIDGQTSQTITGQYTNIEVISDGTTNWWIA